MSTQPGPDHEPNVPVVPSAAVSRAPLISRSSGDLLTAGVVVEVTLEEAATMGAFEETALCEDDAWEANADVGAAAGNDLDDGTGGDASRGGGPNG